MEKRKFVIGLSLIFIFFLSSVMFYLSNYLPILGDGGLIARSTEDISMGNYPTYINHPLLFFVMTGNLNNIIGIYKYFPTLMGILTILIGYVLALNLTKSYLVSILFSLLITLNPLNVLFSSIFFMETTIVFFIFITIYCHIKFIQNNNNLIWLILTGFFLGASISTKQSAYFLPFVIIFNHLFFQTRNKIRIKKSISELFIIFLISIFLSLPILSVFYIKTGTILEPNNPYLTTTPSIKESLELLSNKSYFNRSHLNEYHTLESIKNVYSPSTYYYNESHFPDNLFLTFLIFGLFGLFRLNKNSFYYIIIFLIVFHIFLIIVKVQRYIINSKLLFLIILCYPIIFYSRKKGYKFYKYLSILLVFILLTHSFTLYTNSINSTKSKEYSMCWNPSQYHINNLIKAYKWINENSNLNDRVADPCRNEEIYYGKRDTYWLSPFEDPSLYIGIRNHNKLEIIDYAFSNNIKYIVLIDNLITKNNLNTPQFLKEEDKDFIKMNFPLVHSELGVEIYQLINNPLTHAS